MPELGLKSHHLAKSRLKMAQSNAIRSGGSAWRHLQLNTLSNLGNSGLVPFQVYSRTSTSSR